MVNVGPLGNNTIVLIKHVALPEWAIAALWATFSATDLTTYKAKARGPYLETACFQGYA
jgi:hypothetical protein